MNATRLVNIYAVAINVDNAGRVTFPLRTGAYGGLSGLDDAVARVASNPRFTGVVITDVVTRESLYFPRTAR